MPRCTRIYRRYCGWRRPRDGNPPGESPRTPADRLDGTAEPPWGMPDLFIDDDDTAVLKLLAIPSAAASRLPHRLDSVIYQRREREG